jgi:hypothetical protein
MTATVNTTAYSCGIARTKETDRFSASIVNGLLIIMPDMKKKNFSAKLGL